MPETEDDESPARPTSSSRALAGGAALTFEPDADDDDLLPGDRAAGRARRGRGRPRRLPRRSPPSSPARRPRRPTTTAAG